MPRIQHQKLVFLGVSHSALVVPSVYSLRLQLLANRFSWAHGRRAAEQRDELAALQRRDHSITSSARNKIAVGNSMPIALAVLRFTANSNLFGCSIRKAPTLAPLTILATCAWRPADAWRRNRRRTTGVLPPPRRS